MGKLLARAVCILGLGGTVSQRTKLSLRQEVISDTVDKKIYKILLAPIRKNILYCEYLIENILDLVGKFTAIREFYLIRRRGEYYPPANNHLR